MNKIELIDAVASDAGLKKVEATKAVDAVFDGIIAATKKGEEVRIVGFGSFEVVHRKASKGRNPRTGAEISIAASKAVKFKAGKTLKDAVNEGK